MVVQRRPKKARQYCAVRTLTTCKQPQCVLMPHSAVCLWLSTVFYMHSKVAKVMSDVIPLDEK